MSFDIPTYIEPDIQRYANAQHLTEDQAIIKLLQAGLEHEHVTPSPIAILGAFSSPDERAAMDEALELAMSDRENRNKRIESD